MQELFSQRLPVFEARHRIKESEDYFDGDKNGV
jgi:hypothetical protein